MQSIIRSFAHRSPIISLALAAPALKSFSMSTSTGSNIKRDGEASTSSTSLSSDLTPPKGQLALPEVAHGSVTQLDMSNGDISVKLDHLGPMVVSVDGSLGRISNWEGMTDMEKKNTLRIIGKRNKERLEALRAKESGN